MKKSPSLVNEAFSLAETLHRGQSRKSTDIPYLYHLLSVAALVGEYGGSEQQVAAALLHDAAEDQGGLETLRMIETRLGAQVARYVRACSDCTVSPKPPWRARKEAFIAGISDLPDEVKLIVAADKLHNALSLRRDHRQAGESLWQRFSGGRAGTLWYYQAVSDALAQGWEHPILEELKDAVGHLMAEAHASPPVGET
jgi:(p)ppGpp synthase/HD superfamily hydrolase